MLTDEGGRRHSLGEIRRGPAPLGRRRWTGASRGRKWGRRLSAPLRERGKRVKRGTASGNAFLWWLDGAGGEEKGRGSGLVMRGGRRRSKRGGAALHRLAWHGSSGSGPLKQRRAAHTAWTQGARCQQGRRWGRGG
jgi:hypothetical protein